MTKGLTYITLAALLAASCVKVDIDEGRQAEVSFSTYATRRMTKAGDSFVAPGASFATGAQIGVYGFYHDNSTWAAETAAGTNKPDFMYDQLVEKQENGTWTYSPIKYWPNEYGADSQGRVDKLSFWAYYPYHATGLSLYASGTTTPYNNTTNGYPKLTFTQQEDPDDMIDLMVATPVTDIYRTLTHSVDESTWTYGALTNGAVNLMFTHALALVDFELVEGTNAYINELNLTNICKTGTLADASVLTWSNTTDLYDIEMEDITLDGPLVLRILVIPQSIHADATFSLDYDIHFASSDNTGDIVYSGESAEAKLFRNEGDENDYGVTAWLPGKHYVYRVSAGLDSIEFEEIVELAEDWSSFGDPIEVSD